MAEEKQERQLVVATRTTTQVQLPFEVIRQGFANQLKKLALLNEKSPRIFMVYAHSLYGKTGEEDHAKSNMAKHIQGYLCPTIQAPYLSKKGHLKLNLYSDLAPQGNGSDQHNEYKEADVLYSQMCLLPKHDHSVDYVILCGSRLLQEYSKIGEVEKYTNYLRKMLSEELSKAQPNFDKLYTKAESALHKLKEECKAGDRKFHHIYTELAFLQLRLEEKSKDILPPNNLITVIIDRERDTSSSSIPTALHGNSIYIGAAAWAEQDPKAFYIAIFQLLSRLFGNPKLANCRLAINRAHSTFVENTNPALWTPEDARKFAEQYSTRAAERAEKKRAKAKSSIFALSASSEEDTSFEEEPASQAPSEIKALHNTATTSQIDLETTKNGGREKEKVALMEERNVGIPGSVGNRSMMLIARKEMEGEMIQRGYNPTHSDLPTDNHLETLARIHAHNEKQMQGFSGAHMEAKEAMKGKMMQEIGNEIISFASATSSSTVPSSEVPTLALSSIPPTVSSKSVFPSPVRSNRVFLRSIESFLNNLEDIYKEDPDIDEVCKEINLLIKECRTHIDNITKEERDQIRGKIEEIHDLQEMVNDNPASIEKKTG